MFIVNKIEITIYILFNSNLENLLKKRINTMITSLTTLRDFIVESRQLIQELYKRNQELYKRNKELFEKNQEHENTITEKDKIILNLEKQIADLTSIPTVESSLVDIPIIQATCIHENVDVEIVNLVESINVSDSIIINNNCHNNRYGIFSLFKKRRNTVNI